jgi:lipoate-protein ligase A
MDETIGRAHGEYKVPGGKLVVVDLVVAGGRMTAVQVSGDFFLEPDDALDAITAALEGAPVDIDEAALAALVAAAQEPDTRMYGITAEGVAIAVLRAVDAAGSGAGGPA